MYSKILILALATGLATASCSKSGDSTAKVKSGQSGPAWTLALKSTCGDGSKETCAGFYGFSVDAQGKYSVGTELNGKTRVKQLAADEFAAIQKKVEPYLAALKAGETISEKCEPHAAVSGDTQTLTLSHHGAEAVLARETAQQSCTSLLDAEQTRALALEFGTLLTSKYPTPFPDACLDSIDAFEAKYAELQGCSLPTDCAYVGQDLSVIPYDSQQVVFEEDYSKLAPLVVANAAKLTAAKAALAASREDLVNSCGQSFWKSPVPAAFRQFYSTAGNPICAEGSCKVNPSVYATSFVR